MTPDELVKRLGADLGEDLVSVVLYGSAAAGDHSGRRSDYNILVVVQQLGLDALRAMRKTALAWARAGNRPPLLFTAGQLRGSADAFPIELLDMRDARQTLYGEDLLQDIEVAPENLRLELEHELKGRLLSLREAYLLARGRSRSVLKIMTDSLSTFLVLFRASLRLFNDSVPAKKFDALGELAEHIAMDTEVFALVSELKQGRMKVQAAEADALFGRYLTAVESVVDAVDQFIHKDAGDSKS